MDTKTLKVIAVSEPKTDSAGENYVTITVQSKGTRQIRNLDGSISTVRVRTRPISFNQWENRSQDFLYDAKVGEEVVGSLVTRIVNDYQIEDSTTGESRVVNKATVVVLEDTADAASFEAAIDTAFKNAGHTFPSEMVPAEASVEAEA